MRDNITIILIYEHVRVGELLLEQFAVAMIHVIISMIS